MPTDATGAPTSQGIPTINPAVDAPSGNGENAIAAAIDGLLVARTKALTATGDLLSTSAANTPSRIAAGTNGQVLTVVGGVPAWATAPVVTVPTYTWATLPILATRNSYAMLDDVLGNFKLTYLMKYRDDLSAAKPWLIQGTNVPYSSVVYQLSAFNSNGSNIVRALVDTFGAVPSALDVAVKLDGVTGNSNSQSSGFAVATTTTGTDIVSLSAPGNNVANIGLWLTGANASVSIAAAGSIYLNAFASFQAAEECTWGIKVIRMAGKV